MVQKRNSQIKGTKMNPNAAKLKRIASEALKFVERAESMQIEGLDMLIATLVNYYGKVEFNQPKPKRRKRTKPEEHDVVTVIDTGFPNVE